MKQNSKFYKLIGLLVVMGLLFAALPIGQVQAAATITVCSGGCSYTTIQAAIDAATAGDIINVASGKYTENVVVNKSVALNGAGAATTNIVATAAGNDTLTFAASGATVRGFTITHEYTQSELTAWNFNNKGVGFNQGISGSTLENCIVSLSRNGIYLNTTKNHVIKNNTITNNRTGIALTGVVDGTVITGNIISDNWTIGLVAYGTGLDFSKITVSGNTFSNNWYSEVLVKDSTGSGNLDLNGNTFTDNPVTYSTSADPSLNEPGFAALRPVDLGGASVKPSVDLPTIRIYNSPAISIARSGKTLLVGTGGTYSTIQAAINAAAPGDVINVAAGIYNENLTIAKPLTLLGAGSGVVTVNGQTPVTDAGMLNIVASNVTVEGFKFVGAGYKTIRISAPTSNVTFKDNVVIGATTSVGSLFETNYDLVNHHTDLSITGNTFEGHGQQQLVYINPSYIGLTITGNTFNGVPTSGPVLGIDGMVGTENITGNNFLNIGSAYALFEGFGTVDINAIFGANTWPAGYVASGKMVVPASVVYPSTNDINRTKGWAHVDFVSQDANARTMTFNLIQPRAFYACFEYRTNLQTVPTVAGANPNPAVLDGRWTSTCLPTVGITPITIPLASGATSVEFRHAFGGEKDERFYWTPFTLVPGALMPGSMGYMNVSGVQGVSAGFHLVGMTLTGTKSLVVELFGMVGGVEQVMQTNTAILAGGQFDTLTSFSTPFDIFGTFSYVSDGYWTNVRAAGEFGQNVEPTKAVSTLTLADDTVLTATDNVLTNDRPTVLPVSLVAQDFGYFVSGTARGVTAGFGLNNATLKNAQSVVVKLYAGTAAEPETGQLLQTNTAIPGTDLFTAGWTQFSSPFDIFGTFDYAGDGYWTNVREAEYGQTTVPVCVVAEVTLFNGKTISAENCALTGDRATIILGSLVAQDFGYWDQSGVLGVSAGFNILDNNLTGATSMVVTLYGDSGKSVLLQTNTADLTGTQWNGISQFSSPFDIFGTFDYAGDGYWTNVREAEYGQTKAPVCVVAEVTLFNGKTISAENCMLTGDREMILLPVAVADTYNVAEDGVLTVAAPGVLSNDTYFYPALLTAIKVSDPTHGTLTLNADGSFIYTPTANYNGLDSFTYKANGRSVDSNTVTVTITVTPGKDNPIAVDDFYQTNQDTQLLVSAADGVLKNDIDVDLNNRTVALSTNVTHGVLTLYVDGSFTYMPNLGFYGNDTFIYKLVTYPALTVSDGWTDEATVTITVHEVPAPTFFLYLPLITK
jgi:parallel beta-helix repeat protein/VCBS repeat-containing protein